MSLLYVKTDKGREEIETRASGLSARMRRVLILVDGQRSVADLMSQTGLSLDADALLDELEVQGFIARSGSVSTAVVQAMPVPAPVVPPAVVSEVRPAVSVPVPPTPVASPPQYEPVSLDDLVVMRKLMLDSARLYLGLLGADVIRQLEVANSEEKLRACVTRWHLAMRESRQGRMFAEALFQEVREVLHLELE